MGKQSTVVAKLRNYVETLDVKKYLSTEMRQNLKTIEYWFRDASNWYQEFLTFEESASPEVPDVVAKFAVGIAGDPTVDEDLSKHVLKMERLSVGLYVVTTDLSFTDVNFVTNYIQLATISPNAMSMVLREFDTEAKTITVEFLDDTYAADDITNGSIVGIKFYLTR